MCARSPGFGGSRRMQLRAVLMPSSIGATECTESSAMMRQKQIESKQMALTCTRITSCFRRSPSSPFEWKKCERYLASTALAPLARRAAVQPSRPMPSLSRWHALALPAIFPPSRPPSSPSSSPPCEIRFVRAHVGHYFHSSKCSLPELKHGSSSRLALSRKTRLQEWRETPQSPGARVVDAQDLAHRPVKLLIKGGYGRQAQDCDEVVGRSNR
eukprot:scaffold229403_cov29-Tisochrysis_lutea.AAC.1